MTANAVGDPMLIDNHGQFQCFSASVGVVLADTLPPKCVFDITGVDAVMLCGKEAFVRLQSFGVCSVKDLVL